MSLKHGWHWTKNRFHADDELIKATDLSNVIRELLRRVEQLEEARAVEALEAELATRSGV